MRQTMNLDNKVVLLDCTLRDGGYYNGWNFSDDLINEYLSAMQAVGVDIVEIGFRSLKNSGFKGACAYSTDEWLQSLLIPDGLDIGVMVNASELLGDIDVKLELLFPNNSHNSIVKLVRIACHVHEFAAVLPASIWLKNHGYTVGYNLMQIADRTEDEIDDIVISATSYPVDVLYFADSMGSMDAHQTAELITWIKHSWDKEIGIHAHDNLGLAYSNILCAMKEGVTWIDTTVTGMGRGPGNAKTEYLAIEIAHYRSNTIDLIPLMELISRYFEPMRKAKGWGTNTYYFLAGKYGIHPTYIQEMIADNRYSETDFMSVIEYLREEGGKKFSPLTLDAARHFFVGNPSGTWQANLLLKGREVLLLGTGPGVQEHKKAIESYIRSYSPVVLAFNTQDAIDEKLIDARIASHPLRLLADCKLHLRFPQPLITPMSMLPEHVKQSLNGKEVLDFGLSVEPDRFDFADNYCIVPTSLVVAYALAVATSGKASRILLAGFDGYGEDDPRNRENNRLFKLFQSTDKAIPVITVTPTRYELTSMSIYGMRKDV